MTYFIYFIEIRIEGDSPSFITCNFDANGEQKVVVHTHASLIAGAHNLTIWDTKHGDNVLQTAPSSCSIHLYETLMPLMIVPSGTLVLSPPKDSLNMARIYKTIRDKQITILSINPSLLKILLDYVELNNGKNSEVFEQIRILWISGESLEINHLTKIKSFSSHTRIFFVFNMAETNAAIGREITENITELAELGTLPIGRPLTGYKCLLVDENNDGQVISSLDINQIGQIFLAGHISCILRMMKFCHSYISRCWSFSILFQ